MVTASECSHCMNCKLIGSLSLFGMVLCFGSYLAKPLAGIWLCITYALVCVAVIIRFIPKNRASRAFLPGLMAGALIYTAMARSIAPYGASGLVMADSSSLILAPFIFLAGSLAVMLLHGWGLSL